jgi:tRNA A37 threonylcarbamoyladenosine modification protein TsaB
MDNHSLAPKPGGCAGLFLVVPTLPCPVSHRLVIAIETSNPSAWREGLARPGVAVGVLEGTAAQPVAQPTAPVVGVEDLDTSNPQHDDLLACIDRAVRGAGATPRDVARVGVSLGPGGFTNVRIAATTARMIAEVTGAACVGVPSAVVAARRVNAGGRAFAVALASKGDTAHMTIFTNAWQPEGEGVIMDAGGVASLSTRGVALLVGDRFLPQSMRDAAARVGIEIAEPEFDPVACLEASLEWPAVDPVALAPIYPREPEAVTKWRAMGKGSAGRHESSR